MRSQKTMQKGETWMLPEPAGRGAATSLRHRTLRVLLRARPHAPGQHQQRTCLESPSQLN